MKERLVKFLAYLGIGQTKFEEKAGLSRGFVNTLKNNLTVKSLNKIILTYPELNKDWLLNGDGEMLKESEVLIQKAISYLVNKEILERTGGIYSITLSKDIPESILQDYREKLKKPTPEHAYKIVNYFESIGEELPEEKRDINNENYLMVPMYNFDAVGGMQQSNDITDTPAYIERYVPFPGARKEDICCPVTGNSMLPTYSSGSILLIRRVVGWREYFGYGNCFVLFLKDGRRILKEVQKSEINISTHVLCISYNPKNPSEELSKDFISDVYKVIMVLTNEGF